PTGLVLGTILICMAIGAQVNGRRLRRLAEQRPSEDIGTFARAFDRRTEPFEPWLVRATWDALQPYVRFRDGQVPLRPTDRLCGSTQTTWIWTLSRKSPTAHATRWIKQMRTL